MILLLTLTHNNNINKSNRTWTNNLSVLWLNALFNVCYQIPLLDEGIRIHGEKSTEQLKPLHNRLVSCFQDLRAKVEKLYGVITLVRAHDVYKLYCIERVWTFQKNPNLPSERSILINICDCMSYVFCAFQILLRIVTQN